LLELLLEHVGLLRESVDLFPEPAVAFSEPDDLSSHPVVAFSEPDDLSSHPVVAFSEPDDLFSHPIVAFSEQDDPFSHPIVAFSKQDDLFSHQVVGFSQHVVLFSHHVVAFPEHVVPFSHHVVAFSEHVVRFSHHVVAFPEHVVLFSHHVVAFPEQDEWAHAYAMGYTAADAATMHHPSCSSALVTGLPVTTCLALVTGLALAAGACVSRTPASLGQPPDAPPAAVPCPVPATTAPPSAVAAQPADAGARSRHVFSDGEVLPVPGGIAGRDYVLYVALPSSYAAHPERRYPALYLCDGYWDAGLVRSLYWNLDYDKVIPEVILVGFGYPGEDPDYDTLRRWDYTPVAEPTADGGPPITGHAAEFLGVVEHTIIPLVEREYRVDASYRVLGGSSLGGLFTLYTLFTRPELFQAYIAASPAVRFAHEWLLPYEAAFAQNGGAEHLHARLFMTGAERERPEFLGSIKRFDARLHQRSYPGLTYEFRLIDGERHAGTKAESYNRGVRFAFAPLVPTDAGK
jgi:predicted alpha/beta superfamily hydrolase